ncbi:MAG: serine/threonine-protein kinase [Pseudomonadota bacterium]
MTTTHNHALPAGTSLFGGQLTIDRHLASGGFGMTYLGQDFLGRPVAIKECFPSTVAGRNSQTYGVVPVGPNSASLFEEFLKRFLEEARMLARVRHPNVVHVQTVFRENGTAYIVMDYIGVEEWLAAIRRGIEPARLLEIAVTLLDALEYLHDNHLLHRDIKPSNIRINEFGQPILLDFGAAKIAEDMEGRVASTLRIVSDGYSPTELYVAGMELGPATDLYGLAASLYHAITGKPPAPAEQRSQAIVHGEADPYVPLGERFPDHDAALCSLIDRTMRIRLKERPKDAKTWLSELTAHKTEIVKARTSDTQMSTSSRFWLGALVGSSASLALCLAAFLAWPEPTLSAGRAETPAAEETSAEPLQPLQRIVLAQGDYFIEVFAFEQISTPTGRQSARVGRLSLRRNLAPNGTPVSAIREGARVEEPDGTLWEVISTGFQPRVREIPE